MMRFAIVEDDKQCAELLTGYIKRYGLENNQEFSCTHIPSGLDFISDYQPVYDVVFMDINMPHIDGLKTAQKLRQIDPGVALIFVTNLHQYAIRGYEVNALDFIIKPVSYYDFKMKLIKAIEYVRRNEQNSIAIDTNDVMIRLPLSDLYYVEVAQHRLVYHTARGNYEVYGQLNKVEEFLQGKYFARCDNSMLVNLRHVTEARADAIVVAGNVVPVSRRKKKDFMKLLSTYLGGGVG